MKLFYWCPFTSKVASIVAVLNSADALQKHSSNKITSYIINVFGEWNGYLKEISEKNIQIISLSKIDLRRFLFCSGYVRSRLSYIFIYFYSILSLYKTLKKYEPDYIIVHLITSLPLTLLSIFNFKTKFILRISGFPKLNIFRKLLWKLISKKIHKITFPSKETYELFRAEKIFDTSKMIIIYDPIVSINIINKKKKLLIKNFLPKDMKYILSVGRFTKQKNFELLIEGFFHILKDYSYLNLVIIGEGELSKNYKSLIKKLNLSEKVLLLDYQSNIYQYMNNACCLVSTSLWEDPGFVMIEAASTNTSLVISDCSSGPKEFIENNKGGYLFKSNDKNSFINSLKLFISDNKKNIFQKKVFAKKKSISFTKFRHYKKFFDILNGF